MALEYTHNKDILHRDVKPSNIIIDSDGTAILVDFGLAKAEAQQSVITRGFVGTFSYAPPEQMDPSKTVDSRSDVYSLGVTYYGCLTLHPPFEGDTGFETMNMVKSKEVVPPKKYCPRLSTDHNTVLLHALETLAERRYQSAAEFAADIENILEGRPIIAKRPSITRRAYKTFRRSPLKVTAISAIALIVVLGYLLTHTYTQATANRAFSTGRHKYLIGEYEEALFYFEKSIDGDPDNIEGYKNIGVCWDALRQYDKAVEAYETAIQIDPNYISAYNSLGSTYSALSRHKDAIEVYKRAIKIAPDNINLHGFLVEQYVMANQSEEVIEACERIIALMENADTEIMFKQSYDLGKAYYNLGRYEEATVALNKAINFNPDLLTAYDYLSWAYDKLGDHERVKQVLEELVKACKRTIMFDPYDDHAHSSLGGAYENLDRNEEAIEAYKRAIEINPNYIGVYVSLGHVYSKLRRYKEATEVCTQAIAIDPNFVRAYLYLGGAYFDTGRYEEALKTLKHATEIDPNYVYVYSILGHTYERLGRYEEAIEAYNKGIAIDPNDPGEHNFLGYAYHKLGRYAEAVQALKQALIIDPNYMIAYDNLVNAYCEWGQYEGAIQTCKKAIEIDPNRAISHINLGAVYHKLERYEQAIKAFRQATKIDPNLALAYYKLGFAYGDSKQFGEAIEAYRQAIAVDPNERNKWSSLARNNLAWLYSTCPEDEFRNGKAAVELAKSQMALTGPNDYFSIDTLAAAYAECGDFENAVEWQKKAIELAGDDIKDNTKAGYEKRLTAYRAKKPWRE